MGGVRFCWLCVFCFELVISIIVCRVDGNLNLYSELESAGSIFGVVDDIHRLLIFRPSPPSLLVVSLVIRVGILLEKSSSCERFLRGNVSLSYPSCALDRYIYRPCRSILLDFYS